MRILEVIGKAFGYFVSGWTELWVHWTYWRQEITRSNFARALTVYFMLIGLPAVFVLWQLAFASSSSTAQSTPISPVETRLLMETAKDLKFLIWVFIGFFVAGIRLTIGLVGCVVRRARFVD